MSNPKLLFGAGAIGDTEKGFVYTWTTPESVSSLLESLKDLGFEELDSAANYPPGNPWHAETLLGQTQAAKKGFTIDTKVRAYLDKPCHTPDQIEESILESLRLLGVPSVNILFAHAFDKFTPIEETARGFHEQVVAGRCKKIGLCNLKVADLERYLAVCEDKGYTKPSVIQGNYNLLFRQAETDLLPLLRKHNIKFYGYSPLAGGFLTGKVSFARDKTDKQYAPLGQRSRWEGESIINMYIGAMDHDELHEITRNVSRACESHGSSLADASLRWLFYHSALGAGDGVIIGATTMAQIEQNAAAMRHGPLSKELLAIIEGLSDDAQAILQVPAFYKF